MPAHRWTARSPRLRLRGFAPSLVRPDALGLEARVLPAVFTVNSFTDGVDANPGDGFARTIDGRTTLRAAIMEANALGVISTINLPAGVYTLSLAGAGEDAGATGDLDITAPIVVAGAGVNQTTVAVGGIDRAFDVRSNAMITIRDLTVTGGSVAGVGGAIRSDRGSTLEVDNVALVGNQASGDGGGIAVIAFNQQGLLNLNNDLFQGNSAGGSGGGMFLDGTTAIVKGATFTLNSATVSGGGAAVVDTQSTHLAGAQVSRSTFSGNTTAGQGGAASIQAGIVRATDTTITLNQAAGGGGLANGGGTLGGGNNIVAGNSAPAGPDILGPYNSQGFNLIGNGAGSEGTPLSSDLVGTVAAPIDARLADLALRGGTLPVHVPGPGSPALNVGQAFQPTDQRGDARPATGTDIGAVEARPFGISSPSGGQHAAGGTAFAPLKATVTEGGQGLPGVVVTFTPPTSGPSGSFGDTPAPRTDALGVVTAPPFTANFQPGAYTVRAAASATLFTDITLTNDAAATDTLQLGGAPTSVMSGVPFQITVTALKPDGTRDFNYVGTISFSTDAASASLPPPTSLGTFDQGQATFNFSLTSVGAHFIRANDPNLPVAQVTVNVTPVTNHFDITAPTTVDEGAGFSITLTPRDSNGAVLTGFTGPVTLSSNDPRAVLPANVTFTASDNGVKTIDGLSLRPIGPRTISATAADGTMGTVSVNVTNFGPSQLTLSTDQSAILEGQSIKLSGSFSNPDPLDTHTVVVKWGDGTTSTVPLAAGVFSFQVTHPYADDPAGPNDNYKIDVTVTDAAGGSTAGSTGVAVSNVAPTLPASGGIAIGNQGTPLGQSIAFTDPGADGWTVSVDFGDGSAPQNVAVGPGKSFTLNYPYKTEGTFKISLTLTDDDGGKATLTERAVVFLPGTSGIKVLIVPAGQTGTLSINGATVTLDNEGGVLPAVLLLGAVDLKALANLAGSPTNDPSQLVSAYDIRVLDPGPDSKLTAQLTYPNGQPSADPAVQYYDKVAGAFVSVGGNITDPKSFAVDKTNRQATFILGGTSRPKVFNLDGTVFTLSVPAPAAPAPSQGQASSGTSPFLLAATASPASSVAGIGNAASFSAPIPTTGLVSSSTLTVAVSAAEGLRRGGGDESPAGRLVTPQTLSTVIEAAKELRDFILEAFRMWTDQPAPMEAPAAILPPPDAIDRVHLREVQVSESAAAKYADAAPPDPAAFEAPPVPAPDFSTEDVVIATAEERPWWLKPSDIRAEAPPSDAIPIQLDPSESDRAAAAVTAVWLGGSALAAIVEPPATEEDEDEWPSRDSDESEDGDTN